VAGIGRARGDAATVALNDGTVLYVGGIQSGQRGLSAQLFNAT
jgi:hypothetical protein